MVRLILASSSPRRKELLQLLRVTFETIPPIGVKEELSTYFDPEELADLSFRKARNVYERYPDAVIIGADTVVVLENTVMGKPSSKDEAFEMLVRLSEKMHYVFTAVSVLERRWNFSFIERTAVKFRRIPLKLIGEYVQTGIPLDKAGAYGIQDYGALFTESINGDYYNVMGLPIGRLWQELHTRGVI